MKAFPPKIGGSYTLKPQVILTGVKMDFNLNCNIKFEDYDQVYENTVNDMTECTVGAICLGPTYNIQYG